MIFPHVTSHLTTAETAQLECRKYLEGNLQSLTAECSYHAKKKIRGLTLSVILRHIIEHTQAPTHALAHKPLSHLPRCGQTTVIS